MSRETLYSMTQPPLPANLGTLLDEAAERHPDRLAWRFIESGVDVTYAELRDYTARAASCFQQLGIGHGTHVAVMCPNSLAYCGGWLGLARLGAVVVSVNTRYTSRELYYVLDDAEVEVLLIDEGLLCIFEQIEEKPDRLGPERVLVIDGDAGEWNQRVDAAPLCQALEPPAGLDDIVNIQYTSGTTGFPKGCMLTHRFWMLSSKLLAGTFEFPLQRVIYNQNFFYMDGPFLACLCLFAGATCHFVSRPSVTKFLDWVRQYDIEYCFYFEALYKIPEREDDADNPLKCIHLFGFNKTNHADLERRFDVVAREAYGMTECGGGCAMPWDATHMVGSGSCGLPAQCREAMIVDDQHQPVEPGEVGELLLRGPGMMLGYYRKPEANAEAFYREWLCTGDLFRQDENGYFYIVGRKKDMVRRNAENIACREVEAVLRELEAVKEAAVVAVPDERVGEEVKAYIQLQQGYTEDAAPPRMILAHCAERLAVFKVPRYIEYRKDFPMTDSARVEKNKVKAESPDLRLNSYDRVDEVWR